MTTTTTSRRTAHLVIGVLATLASFPLAQSRNQTLTAPIGLELDASLEGFVLGQGVNIGTPIGFAVLDSDGDGRDEIINGGVPRAAWERIVHDPDLPGYRIDRVAPHPYPFFDNATGQHAGDVWLVADAGMPARPKIFSQIANSTIAVYDARTGQLDRISETSPRGYIGHPVAAADLDGDGANEIVFTGDDQISVYDGTLTRWLASSLALGSMRQGVFVLGNFDADPALEVANGTGRVFEFAGYSLRPESSTIDTRFGDENIITFLGAEDVDADGIDEIFVVFNSQIRLIDLDLGTIKWVAPRPADSNQIQSARIVDVNGDGVSDILVGEAGHPADPGFICAYDGRTGAEIVRIQHPDINAKTINAGDFDGDGQIEIATQLIRPLTGPDRIYIHDAATGQLEWRSVHEDTPPSAIGLGDADGDGVAEIVYAPRGLVGVGDVRLYALDPITFARRWVTTSQVLSELGTGAIVALAIGDVDRDGDPDIVVGTSKDLAPQLWIIDGRTRTSVRGITLSAPGDFTGEVTAMAIEDVDADGADEIVAVTSPLFTGRPGYLHIIDGATGTIEWTQALPSPGASYGLELGDVDGDGTPNIVVMLSKFAVTPGEVIVADARRRTLSTLVLMNGLGLALADTSGGPAPEIALGGIDGRITVIDGVSGSVLSTTTVCDTFVYALARNRLAGASPAEAFFTCRDRVGTIDLATADFRILAGSVGEEHGWANRLLPTGSSSAQAHLTFNTMLGLRHLRPSNQPPAPTFIPASADRPFWYETHWRRETFGQPKTISYTGLPLQLELVEPPQMGDVTFQGVVPGVFRYIPRPVRGVDHFVVRLNDGVRTSAPVAMAVQVLNSAPAMPSGGFQRAGTIGMPVLARAGANDSDSDPLRHELVTPPSNGTVDLAPETGDFIYTPNSNAVTQDSFSLRATDTVEWSETAVVNITLQPPAPPPPPPPAPPPSGGSGGGGGVLGSELLILFAMLLVLRLRTRTRFRHR